MPNAIERDVYVLRNTLKNPIAYVRGTDLLPIIFHFRDFAIPSGATATAFTAKPDGNAVYGSAVISGNDVTIGVTQQMFIVLGMSMLQVEIKEGEETLTTFIQPVMVEPNLKAGDLPESTTDVEFIDKIIEQAQEAVDDANVALGTANIAINGANTAASAANQAAQNANNAAEDLQDKVDAGDFTASVQVGTTTTLDPDQDATVSNSGTNKDAVLNFGIPKGDPGTAASIQVGTTQTVQPEENAEVTNTGTTSAAVLNFKIPRGKDGMTDLTAEYTDDSSYTCEPTVNAPVILKEIAGKTEQGENPSPDNPQVIKGVGGMGYFDGELVQGSYNQSGVIVDDDRAVCSANKIKCKQGDKVDIAYEGNDGAIYAVLFKDGVYVKNIMVGAEGINITDDANEFGFYITKYPALLPISEAKYISVTINGKYQTGVEVHGAQLLQPKAETDGKTTIVNGVSITQNNMKFKISGTCTSNGGRTNYFAIVTLPPGSYLLSSKESINPNLDLCLSKLSNGEIVASTSSENGIAEISDETEVGFGFNMLNDITYNIELSVMFNSGSTALPYQPYHHTAISIPLTSPLYEGDKICYVKPGESYIDENGDTVVADRMLYGVYRENGSEVFDGSEDEAWAFENINNNRTNITLENCYNLYTVQSAKCNLFKYNVNVYVDAGNEIGFIVSSKLLYIRFGSDSEVNSLKALKTWLQSNNLEVVYKLAQPWFEPFDDQSIFYGLRTDDTLSYVYSNDPIEPVLTVEVAKNSTGGYLLESYAQAQKNAIAEANSQSRLSAIEQQLVNQATTPTE